MPFDLSLVRHHARRIALSALTLLFLLPLPHLAMADAVFLPLAGGNGTTLLLVHGPDEVIEGDGLGTQTVLTLTGSRADGKGISLRITDQGLVALPAIEMNTENEFVDGMTTFAGPLARDMVALLDGAVGSTVRLTAVNDYSVEIPIADFAAYDVVFAHSMNGERLSTRDFGPVWVVYPFSDHAELRDPVYNARLIWQLVMMELN